MSEDLHQSLYALNGHEIYLLLEELSLAGAKIEYIYQENYEECVLELYSQYEKKYLVINVSKYSHLYVSKKYHFSKVKSLRFKELLNSKIRSGRIDKVISSPHDRTIVFHVKRGDIWYYLAILLWGNASNIYLCNSEWQILDAFYRKKVGVAENQLKRYFDLQHREKKEIALVRFTPINTSLNEAIIQFYRRKKDVEIKIPPAIELRLLKQIKNYKKELVLLMNLDEKEKVWQEKEMHFYNQIFSTPEAYQEAWAKHQQEAEKLYKEIKKKDEKRMILEDKIVQIEATLMNLSHTSALKQEVKKPFLHFVYQGYTIFVGRNAKENDMLLKHHSRGLDYWFHIHQARGGFVLVKYQKNLLLPSFVIDAAKALAHYFSKAREQTEGEILFTQVKELKRTKVLGQVEVKRAKTLYYKANRVFLEELLNQYLVK